jgi:hypothetical protein
LLAEDEPFAFVVEALEVTSPLTLATTISPFRRSRRAMMT